MTDSKRSQSAGRHEQGSSLAWKSGLLASSLGSLLLGWALLGQASPVPASKVAEIASPKPRVIVVQVPIPAASNGNQQLISQPAQPAQASGQAAPSQPAQTNQQAAPASQQISMPAMPQRPVFQQPVTSTRGS